MRFGLNGLVARHMTLPGAVAAVRALSLGAGNGVALAGAANVDALLGELYLLLFLIHDDNRSATMSTRSSRPESSTTPTRS